MARCRCASLILVALIAASALAQAPSPEVGNAVLLAGSSVRMDRDSVVVSGDLVANNAGSTLSLDQGVSTPTGFALKANSVRIKPENGVLFGKGIQVLTELPEVLPQNAKQSLEQFSKAIQVTAKEGAAAAAEGEGVKVTIPKGKSGSVLVKPAQGRWDLRQAIEVRVKVRNTGQT